jgi:hypothetical protein
MAKEYRKPQAAAKKGSSFLQDTRGIGKNKQADDTVTDLLEILGEHDTEEQNQIIGTVLKKLKQNRLRAAEETSRKLAASQGDIASLDAAINTGLNASYEPEKEEQTTE